MLSIVSSVSTTSPTSTSENVSEHWTRMCTIHIASSFPLCREILLIATNDSDCADPMNIASSWKNRSIALAFENRYNDDQYTSSSEHRMPASAESMP